MFTITFTMQIYNNFTWVHEQLLVWCTDNRREPDEMYMEWDNYGEAELRVVISRMTNALWNDLRVYAENHLLLRVQGL